MTNTFEKTYQIDPQREKTDNLDKHRYIEVSDEEFLKKCQLVYRPPNLEEPMSPIKKKIKSKAKK